MRWKLLDANTGKAQPIIYPDRRSAVVAANKDKTRRLAVVKA